MSAPVLLSDYKMKKKRSTAAKRESEASITLEFMREFRAEMMSQFAEVNAKFRQIDARLDRIDARFEQIDARFDQMEARFVQIDARFDENGSRFIEIDSRFVAVDARFEQMNGKIDQVIAEMRTANHQTKLLIEEQNLRNKQAYDGYVIVYEAVQDLKSRIKPECLN
jgi:chromosome segregation ATPase